MEVAVLFSETTANHTTSVNAELNYLIGTLSLITYILVAMVMFLYSKGDSSDLGVNINNGILFSTCFVAMLTNLSIKTGKFHDVYILVIAVFIGTVLNIYGSQAFFKSPGRNDTVLDNEDPTIRYILLGVTLPMCLIELLVSVITAKDNALHAAEMVACMLHKLIQTGLFHFSVCRRTPIESKRCGASWYMKVIALFNFSMWLQVIADGTVLSDVSLESVIGAKGSSLVSGVYASLLVDYRLLCAILYLEYGLAIDNWDKKDQEQEILFSEDPSPVVRIHTSQHAGMGYMLGVLVFLCQFITLLLTLEHRPIGLWVNIFSIAADLLTIIPGIILICLVKENNGVAKETNLNGLEMMVLSMGLVGLVYWSLRASIALIISVRMYHETMFSHLVWLTVISITRIAGIPFQLFFFVRITPQLCSHDKVRNNKMTYFLVPCVLFGLMSVFVNTVINNHSILEDFVHEADLNVVMTVVCKMGELLHLGFCLHMFFHFLIVNNTLRRQSSGAEKRDEVAVISNGNVKLDFDRRRHTHF